MTPLPRRAALVLAAGAALAGCGDAPPPNEAGVSPTPVAARGRRVALVVGQARYRFVPVLRNTAEDARIVADALAGDGFELVDGRVQRDLGKSELDLALRRLAREAAGADTAVLYFAGHGVQGHGENWLAPVDAAPPRGFADLDFGMVALPPVLRELGDSGARLTVLLLDACRENPFLAPALGGMERGLLQAAPPPRCAIMFSTQPGDVAEDGFGAVGPFAAALAPALRRPDGTGDETVGAMLTAVSGRVWRESGARQRPWIAGDPATLGLAFVTRQAPG